MYISNLKKIGGRTKKHSKNMDIMTTAEIIRSLSMRIIHQTTKFSLSFLIPVQGLNKMLLREIWP